MSHANRPLDARAELHRLMQLQAVAHQKQREADQALIQYLLARLVEERDISHRLAGLADAACCEHAGPDGSDPG